MHYEYFYIENNVRSIFPDNITEEVKETVIIINKIYTKEKML